jgi:hypothetical protein
MLACRTMGRPVEARSAKLPLRGRFISAAAGICRMNALYGFGFTRAFIFPYDELYFCRSGACSAHADFDRAQVLYFFENDPARRELCRGKTAPP